MTAIVDAFQSIPRDRRLIYAPALDQIWTAAVLDDAAHTLARCLAAAGVSGDLVASQLGNHPASVASLLACRYLDAPLMPLDAGATPAETTATIERFGARAVLVPAPADPPRGCESVSMAGDVRVCVRTAEAQRYPGIAMLKLTSGSTGMPKATLTAEAHLCSDSANIVEAMGIRPDDIQIAVIPLSHAYAVGNLVVPLLLQGTAIVVRDGFVPHRVMEDAAAFGARVWPGVPFMFQHMLEHPPERWPETLTHMISAGAPLHASTVTAMHAAVGSTIHSFYGTSESGGIAFDERVTPRPSGTSGFVVGRPLPRVTVTLRPDEQAAAPAGRVHVTSRGVAAGYAGLQDVSFTDGGFLTGDLGSFDADGRLVLTGRVSSFVNVAGKKVQPAEVEAVLREADGVGDAKVFGVPDERRGETLVACVVGDPSADPAALRRHCISRLSPQKVPRVILHFESWPLTERGKVDRLALTEAALERLGGPKR
jgi:long-chain acyl-CoA synthetase